MNVKLLVSLLFATMTACATASGPPPPSSRELTPPTDTALAEELAAMAQEDQEVRQRWTMDQGSEAIRSEIRQMSLKHVARLEQIIATHGWPGISLVGFNGMNQAWLLAQHGGQEFLERTLPSMYEAVKRGELDESLYGTSLDRVLIRQGRKQMYGTQFDVDPAIGRCEPKPMDDPEHVDERRVRSGMTTLKEYTKELCEMYLAK